MNIIIKDKIISFLNDTDERMRYLIFAGVLLLIFMLDYFILMKPQLTALTKIIPKNRILIQDINKTKEDIQRIPEYKKSIDQSREKLDKFGTRILSKRQLSVILERISKLANENNVLIDDLMPNMQSQEKILESPDRRYFTLPILIELRGGYHNFGKFLNQIEKAEIVFKVDSLTMTRTDDPQHLAIKLSLKTIVFEDVSHKKGRE
jgi:Tfp pilus assembly protein PilO